MRFSHLFVGFMALVIGPVFALRGQSPTDRVHPLVGTVGEGQTFPSVGVPFGMTGWTPATRDTEAKGVAPYYHADTRLRGFRGSHFLSGSATQDYGSFQILAGHGTLDPGGQPPSSTFTGERATPFRYDVTLPELGVEASITGTSRCGLLRFVFKEGGPGWLSVRNNARPGDGATTLDPVRHEITGSNAVRRLYAGAGKRAGFSGYVVVQFDHSFHTGGPLPGGSGTSIVFDDLKPGEAVEVRVGTSFTSVDEARRNLQAEIPGWDFERIAAASKVAWDKALGAVEVRGSEEDQARLYTALYHAMLLPRTFSDVSGTYPRFASADAIETARGFTYYDDFSAWDTFRALHPLLTLLDPSRDAEMVQSLIVKGEQGGYLPIFPAWNSYTSEMIGDHDVSIIGDAYLKGIRGFDIDRAYALMRKNATQTPPPAEYTDGKGRRALASYLRYGYIPLEDTVPDAFHKNEQVSRTLEYAYDDFILSRVAAALGKREDAKLFATRARNYRNVLDPETRLARGRHADGTWATPFEPSKLATYVTESTPFEYTFFVPQDIPGLVAFEGGAVPFVARLDELFVRHLYVHGNEPGHHIAYLYDYAGAAAKTQARVADILRTQYADRPDGLSGNDDAGQMSAWFVFSALGFYPVTPGIPAYAIGTPLFDDVRLHLPNGKLFHIVVRHRTSGSPYVRSVSLNGKPLDRFWLRHEEIAGGGELVFEMSPTPTPWPTGKSVPE